MCVDWVRQAADAHAKAFQLAKAPRKLSFEPALGAVEVELEIGGCVQTYSVSPVLATIILPFEQHESITAAQLVKMTSIPMDVILRKYANLHAFPAVRYRYLKSNLDFCCDHASTTSYQSLIVEKFKPTCVSWMNCASDGMDMISWH